ncbi:MULTISPECIES: AraC family transcriptional regulator [unclassified Modicisalibacter]|uniref:AraC family transcriptional regulator n=1 Tax=unclassified Modicisalibacter TaxID=2679913 RepID=UPI001CCFDE91|nr:MULTISPECIES: AraC family transcriptional regulator [unclassified Modicisalibacter]MBZ9557395.1 helix-turn-helix domain-containing protein [Modicisalibacter sp. R2A 31.J]MBZ9573939.1 helix-turn-helix domain-containing protein [Modicisalibacter sp. MOD 31.J]
MTSAIRLTPLDNTIKHHDHDFHQIVIGLDGHAEFEIEGLGGRIAALSGCIVPANHVHYYEGIGTNRQLIFDLPDDTPALSGIHREHARLFDAPRFFALDEPLHTYLNFLVQELAQPQAAQGDLLAATFLGCLRARLPQGSANAAPGRRRSLDLAALDDFIQRNLERRLSVADLADRACLSVAHFSECFREQAGVTPYQYLLRHRLTAARRLLAESRLPLNEIAARTGFASQSALSHAFRRVYHQPPGELRRRGTLQDRRGPEDTRHHLAHSTKV